MRGHFAMYRLLLEPLMMHCSMVFWENRNWLKKMFYDTNNIISSYRSRLPEFSVLPRDPSRNTLCRVSGSLNGLRCFRVRVASNGRYICGMYGVKLPVNPELLGFNESHSCFNIFGKADGDAADELFLWILRSCSCDCDCAAAKRPCSVDKPLTYNFIQTYDWYQYFDHIIWMNHMQKI